MKLFDMSFGSPATGELVLKHRNIQNIPALDYLKAQLAEDVVGGSLSGMVLAAPVFGVNQAYKAITGEKREDSKYPWEKPGLGIPALQRYLENEE